MTATRERQRDDAGLGYTQRLVLQLLALGEHAKTVRTLAHDWPGLSEGSVRSAITRLGTRGLVEPVRFGHDGREFDLTARGEEVERALSRLVEDDDVEESA